MELRSLEIVNRVLIGRDEVHILAHMLRDVTDRVSLRIVGMNELERTSALT